VLKKVITINIDPVAFTIGTLEVRWYGIFVALAVAVVVFWTAMQVKRGAGITYDTVFTAALIGIPSGIVVSRLLHVVDRWDYYIQNPSQIIGAEGLTIYGAVLGAALGVWIYSKFSRFRFGYVTDLIAPGIILSQAVGRIGCILNGCCFGAETTLPWGIVYTHPGSVCPVGVVVQPTQFYAIIYNLLVFGILLKLRDRFPFGE
jgi:phosphatidylglycerol:prolipoprotein diacylglycerol transferase